MQAGVEDSDRSKRERLVVGNDIISDKTTIISPSEIEILDNIARTGVPLQTWQTELKPLLRRAMEYTINAFALTRPFTRNVTVESAPHEEIQNRTTTLLKLLDNFSDAPFTIQRLCELILRPLPQYSTLNPYLRALEVALSVTTTRPPGSPDEVALLQQQWMQVEERPLPWASTNGTSNSTQVDVAMPPAVVTS